MIKLLEAIKQLNLDLSNISKIQSTLECRLDWLNDREPEGDGVIYDKWQDKVDDLEEIIDNIAELKEESNKDDKIKLIKEIQDSVQMYQVIHGGLSRLIL